MPNLTALFGIVGDPIAQARSPSVFNALFQKAGIDAVMVPMHVTSHKFEKSLSGLRQIQNLAGLIITVPHKVDAAKLASAHSDRVSIAGAANALKRTGDGWSADLFDGEGFAQGMIAEGYNLKGKNCAVVGCGGAGAAISLALTDYGVASLKLWDTDLERANSLSSRISRARRIEIVVSAPSYDTEIAINATPLGMNSADGLPIDLQSLKRSCIVADVIMKPQRTKLLELAAACGHPTQEGRHMLDNQVRSIWNFFSLPALANN